MDGEVSKQLLSIRSRAEDIKKLLMSINAQDPNWVDVLNQYIALSGQFARLSEAITPLLGHFIVVPNNLHPDPNLVPEWLRTKFIPEIEDADKQVLQSYLNIGLQEEKISSYKILCADVSKLCEDHSERIKSRPERPVQAPPTLLNVKEMVAAITLGNTLRVDTPLSIAPSSTTLPIFPGTSPLPSSTNKPEEAAFLGKQMATPTVFPPQAQHNPNYPYTKQHNSQIYPPGSQFTSPVPSQPQQQNLQQQLMQRTAQQQQQMLGVQAPKATGRQIPGSTVSPSLPQQIKIADQTSKVGFRNAPYATPPQSTFQSKMPAQPRAQIQGQLSAPPQPHPNQQQQHMRQPPQQLTPHIPPQITQQPFQQYPPPAQQPPLPTSQPQAPKQGTHQHFFQQQPK